MRDPDGKHFKRCKFGLVYGLKCRCFKDASVKNILTILFNWSMMLNAILKISMN